MQSKRHFSHLDFGFYVRCVGFSPGFLSSDESRRRLYVLVHWRRSDETDNERENDKHGTCKGRQDASYICIQLGKTVHENGEGMEYAGLARAVEHAGRISTR